MNSGPGRIVVVAAVIVLGGCLTRPLTGDGGGEGSTGDAATTTEQPPAPVTTTAPTSADDTSASATGSSDTTGPLGPGLGEECELHFQDCQPGLKCMPYSTDGGSFWNEIACFPVDPDPVGLGEECQWSGGLWSGYDNCGPGQVCWQFSEDEPGECKDLCLSPGPNPYDDVYCTDPLAVPHVGCQECFCVCEYHCNPLTDDCDEGDACYPGSYDLFQCIPDASEDLGAYGDPCEFINVCDPGLMCASADALPSCEGSIGCCTPFCDITLPNPCPDADLGMMCVPWWDPGRAPIGLEDVGVCVLQP